MNQESLKDTIMKGIHEGKVQMRPRWHFVLFSALVLVGSLLMCFTLIYAISLLVYLLQVNGEWFAPSLGLRGWASLLHSLPWLLLPLLVAFVVILEILVRRYTFVYKKPLLISVLGVMGVVIAGGFLVSLTPLHDRMARFDRIGMLPPPFDGLYREPPEIRSPDLYRGRILQVEAGRILVINRAGTTTILVDPRTRLPYGSGFSEGDMIIVIGDYVATGTIHAFGIRTVTSEDDIRPR